MRRSRVPRFQQHCNDPQAVPRLAEAAHRPVAVCTTGVRSPYAGLANTSSAFCNLTVAAPAMDNAADLAATVATCGCSVNCCAQPSRGPEHCKARRSGGGTASIPLTVEPESGNPCRHVCGCGCLTPDALLMVRPCYRHAPASPTVIPCWRHIIRGSLLYNSNHAQRPRERLVCWLPRALLAAVADTKLAGPACTCSAQALD